MGKRGVQHWKKRKAIAAYLFRRRWWDIKLDFSDSIAFSELVSIQSPASIITAYADSFGFTEDLSFTPILGKSEIVDILDTVTLSLEKEATVESFGISDTLTTSFNRVVSDATADGVTFSEQLDILFNLASLQDSVGFTETYSTTLTKVITDGFALDDISFVDKDYTFNKSNVFSFTEQVSISGTFANRKLGGEPFNALTFN